MATGSVTTTGLDEFHRAVESFPDRVRAVLQGAARDTANQMASRARQLCPVQTGRTRDSIRVEEDLDANAYHVKVGPTMERPADQDYPANVPIWIEYGTRYKLGRPFMRPAADALRESYRQRLERLSATLLEQQFG